MQPTRLLLVRHGESIAQAEGIVGGPKGCRGLSDLGRWQVGRLRDRWQAVGLEADVLLASTLPRAMETAEILNEVLGLTIEPVDALCEIIPGECDGTPWSEFEARFHGGDYRWDPYTPTSPGGESWFDFQGRISNVLAEIVQRHAGRTIVAAVHGGVVEGSAVHFLGLSRDAGNVLQTANASVTEWEQIGPETGWSREGWRLVRFNDHAHVETP